MKVFDIMSRNVVTVSPNDQLKSIQGIFQQKPFHHLLVVEDDELLGVISDRDLLKNLSPFISTLSERQEDSSTLEKRVDEIMTRAPIVINKDADIKEAAELMVKNTVSCLPVMESAKSIAGIITWRDILTWLSKQGDDTKNA